MAVKDRVIFVPRGPRGLVGAQGPAGDPSVETARIDEFLDPRTENPNIHLDAINGNDLNSGSSISPIASFGKAFELCKAGYKNTIQLMSDVTVSEQYIIAKNLCISIITHSYSTNPKRKITFADTGNGHCGGFAIENGINVGIQFLQTVIELDCSFSTRGVLFSRFCARVGLRTWGSEILMTPANQGYFLYSSIGGLFDVVFQTTPFTGTAGYIFSEVSAGENPNDLWQFRTNIIAA